MEHYFTNNNDLKSELRDIKYTLGEYNFMFKSDNGVFSKNEIDYGSEFLVKTFLESNKKNINNLLDVGCGYGFIGVTLAKILNAKVTMIDVNKRAVHLTKMNIEINKVNGECFESNIYENINNKYDLIISNPPIRAGKDVVLKILVGGLERLNKDGELWFVIRKNQGAESIKKRISKLASCIVVAKSKGFWIFCAKNR